MPTKNASKPGYQRVEELRCPPVFPRYVDLMRQRVRGLPGNLRTDAPQGALTAMSLVADLNALGPIGRGEPAQLVRQTLR